MKHEKTYFFMLLAQVTMAPQLDVASAACIAAFYIFCSVLWLMVEKPFSTDAR